MMNHPFRNRKRFLFFPFIGLAFVLAGGLAVMLLWNAVIPSIMNQAAPLTFGKAVGLLLLCNILFGGFRGRPGGFRGGPPWRNKMASMTDEEREKFKSEWRERCGRKE
jgi:hypothetical protein